MVQKEFDNKSLGNSGSLIEKMVFLILIVLLSGAIAYAGYIIWRIGHIEMGGAAWVIAGLIFIICLSGILKQG